MNANVSKIFIQSFNVDLDEKLLNKNIFRSIRELEIDGRLNSIQNDLFSSFDQLRLVRLQADCFRQLISRQGIEWIKSMNKRLNVNLSDMDEFSRLYYEFSVRINLIKTERMSTDDRESNYFTEADLCLFWDFPFHQMIHFDIINQKYIKEPYTCTDN